jgi:antitoxin component YwqK of YwqJK toxin-antitoxin module
MKKNNFWTLTCLFVLNFLYAQPNKLNVVNKWEGGKVKTAYKIMGSDSISYQYYSNGKLRIREKYLVEFGSYPIKKDTFSLYYESGKLNYEILYHTINSKGEDEKLSSHRLLYKGWYETGELKILQYYELNKISKFIEFYKNGRTKLITHYNIDGSPLSIELFYGNGYLKEEYTEYKDSVTYGTFTDSSTNESYQEARGIRYPSLVKFWHKNGLLASKGVGGPKGKKRGKWLYYDEKGRFVKEENYD